MNVHLVSEKTSVDEGSVTETGTSDASSAGDEQPASDKKRRRNRRNDRSSKTIQGDLGEVTIATPRDRDGTFEPKLAPKHQRCLAGFPDAIRTVYENRKVQLCVVHLVRSALRYVSDTDSRAVARDLKKIYNAATLPEAEVALEEFASTWDEKYPTIAKSWRAKWTDIITLFDFSWPIRKAISTTNAMESVNSW